MKKLFTAIFLIVLIIAGINFGLKFTKVKHADEKVTSTNQIIQSSKNEADSTEQEAPVGIPELIKIPKINVSAKVEQVGLDEKRAMDVPKEANNAGWYNLGVKPGEAGNAVIDGHLDKESGAPAVFWDVDKLQVGDKIIIVDDKGTERTFSVVKKAEYPYNDFPLQEVFGHSSKSMLNLISCNGKWNSQTHNYSHRTVIYSEQI